MGSIEGTKHGQLNQILCVLDVGLGSILQAPSQQEMRVSAVELFARSLCKLKVVILQGHEGDQSVVRLCLQLWLLVGQQSHFVRGCSGWFCA
jgi:hypothetical protein